MNNRAGTYKNNLSGEMAYKSFMPSVLPPNPSIELDKDIIDLLVKANKQLALLEGISNRIPNIHLFISMYVRKEALMSSQIEGTQATLEDVLDPCLEENTNRPVGDVVNYIKATDYAISRLKELPLCNRLIKEAHEVLLSGVRGQNKSPGEFRHSQNWIGAAGCNLQNARYIPPSVEDMIQAMSDLEKYINGDDDLDVLIRAALIHYQFETIHPFLDGNGRIGRLLITLFLMEKKVLSTPALYISYFLKRNRIEYYDRIFNGGWGMRFDRTDGYYTVQSPWEGRAHVYTLSGSRTDLFVGDVQLPELFHAEVYNKTNGVKDECVTFYGPGAQWGSGGVNHNKIVIACYSPENNGWFHAPGLRRQSIGKENSRIIRFIKSPVEYIY